MEDKIEIFENDNNEDPKEFYRKFKEKLNESQRFPSAYMYKFIVPNDHSTLAMLHAIFENSHASFSNRDSKNGKYTSVTIQLMAKDADEVINYYQEVASITGVVML